MFETGAGSELAAASGGTSAGWQQPPSAVWVGRWSPGCLGTRRLHFLHPCAPSSSTRLLGRVLMYGCFSNSASVSHCHPLCPFFSFFFTCRIMPPPHSAVRNKWALCFRWRRSSEVDVPIARMERRDRGIVLHSTVATVATVKGGEKRV